MKKFMIAGVMLGLGALPTMAEYTVKGSVECPDIIKEDANENYREFNKWWLLGYFSARNYMADQRNSNHATNLSSTVGKGVDNDQIYSMALNFCTKNPTSDWDDAAIHIYDLLTPPKTQ